MTAFPPSGRPFTKVAMAASTLGKHASGANWSCLMYSFQLSYIHMFQSRLVWFVVVHKDIIYTSQDDEEVCFSTNSAKR